MSNDEQWLQNSPQINNNIEKVRQLLLSKDDENVELAFQLLKSGGIPTELEKIVQEWVLMCVKYDFPELYRNIYQLDLGYWNLHEIPKEVFKLNNLKTLSLKNNLLTQLPKEIIHLAKLEILQLYKNQISFLPLEIKHLSSLRRLDISYNQLRVLPKDIGALENLEILNLGFNQLGKTKFPDDFIHLRRLQKLDLKANGLYKIPSILTNMNHLKEVFFNYNFLTFKQVQTFQESLPEVKVHYHSSF